jgi:squalene-hopene/tetraprenyl-beta-curcumene cyclase
MHQQHWLAAIVFALTIAGNLPADDAKADKPADFVKPQANSPDEPLAKEMSLAKTAEFLDNVAVVWTREKKCGTCHTNYPYLMARAALTAKGETPPGYREVRKFFEDRIANWDRGEKGDKPRWDAEVVATAVTLAINDAQTSGKLHPLTKQALDRMWTVQKKNGGWEWLKCNWPPFEHDDYYGAVFAAVGVSVAPEGYVQGESAKEGLARLKDYFQKTPAPDLHHKAYLLWASLKLDGLMTKAEQQATIKELLTLQRDDGGWSLPSLADWQGHHGKPNDKTRPSDGYATGLAVYILRQAGMAANNDAIQRGVKWLKSNQRESGRWFTYSLNSDKTHYITNAGTSFAVLALKACE